MHEGPVSSMRGVSGNGATQKKKVRKPRVQFEAADRENEAARNAKKERLLANLKLKEAIAARVRARIARDMKVLEACEALFEPSVDIETLEASGAILRQQDYKDCVKERTIRSRCGYPLCSSKPSESMRRGSFTVCLDEPQVYHKKVFPTSVGSTCPFQRRAYLSCVDHIGKLALIRISLRSCCHFYVRDECIHLRQARKYYCSAGCFMASRIFMSQLPEYRPLFDVIPAADGKFMPAGIPGMFSLLFFERRRGGFQGGSFILYQSRLEDPGKSLSIFRSMSLDALDF